MDFIYFTDLGSNFQSALAINNISSASWIERYRAPGEFTIKAPVTSNLREDLFIGRVITHLDTEELMIVENHEIDENADGEEPQIVITGRSFETTLEYRSVGENIDENGGTAGPLPDYAMGSNYAHVNAVHLVNNHIFGPNITAGHPEHADDQLYFVFTESINSFGITPTPAVARVIKRGTVYQRMIELLEVDDFGIRVRRPTIDSPTSGTTRFVIHNGYDKTADVIFSYASGDLINSRYFFSLKGLRTHVHVVSKYNEIRVGDPGPYDFMRRIAYLDASDLDEKFATYPTGTDRTNVLAAMQARGEDYLKFAKETSLVSTDVSMSTKYKYRRDYDIGDVVSVEGNYGVSGVMRITEHAEFQDENGETGYPTLSAL